MMRLLLLCAGILYAADPETLIRQVAEYDYGKDPTAVRELEALTVRSGASLEKLLRGGLASAKTLAAKDVFCRQLALAGTDASVPPLAAMLLDRNTAEMARAALERIPGDRSVAALRDALPHATLPIQVGIAASLGRRRDRASTDALTRLLGSTDARLASAAASALGNIGTPAALDALLAARTSPAVTDALLAMAEQSAAPEAARIYRHLGPAGLEGLARVDPAGAAPRLREALKGTSAPLQAIAIRNLARTDGAALVKEFPSLSALAHQRAISALADSGNPDFRLAFVQAAGSDSELVRIAALGALARVGTAGDIPLLAKRAAQTSGEERTAARAALAAIRGSAADAAIVQAIPGADTPTKVELIRAAGERGIASAADTLLLTSADADRQVRIESIRALRETAGVGHAAPLLEVLKKASGDNERRELERAVAAAIRRSPNADIAGALQSYESSDAGARVSLLNVLSAVGNSAALPAIRQALQDPAPEIRRAALNALTGWPTPEPLDDLLALARSAGDPARQTLALRGYIRLVQLPSARTPAETAALLKTAMGAATRVDEKRSVLAIAQRVVCPESLAVARSAVDDPQVKAEAQLAVETLERGLAFVGK